MIKLIPKTDLFCGSGDSCTALEGSHSPRLGVDPVTKTCSQGRAAETSTEKWSELRGTLAIRAAKPRPENKQK